MILRKLHAAVGPLILQKAFRIQCFKRRTCVKSTTERQASEVFENLMNPWLIGDPTKKIVTEKNEVYDI